MDDTYKRVARALADVETEERARALVRDVSSGRCATAPFRPAASPRTPARCEHKPATSTINCTVSGTIRDSMDDILSKVHEAGLTLKAGCGIGYEFSTLRPRGAYVSGAGAYTSGPLSFMDIYDKMCFTVSSAGGRRGAQMGTFDVGHPDVMEFIRAKRENGRLRQFNLSLLITDEFMQRRARGPRVAARLPAEQQGVRCGRTRLCSDADQFIWREWPVHESYVVNEEGLVACRIYKTLPARRMWDVIMTSTYDFAEPGFILIDRVNEMNNNWWCENIRATNPCGEQPLPPYGSCLLGSVNLTRFVARSVHRPGALRLGRVPRGRAGSSRACSTTWSRSTACRSQQQRDEIMRKRRHGMGFLGLGSTHHDAGHEVRLARIGRSSPRTSRARWRVAGWEAGARAGAREGSGADHERGVRGHRARCCASAPRWSRDGWKLGAQDPGPACCTPATAATCSGSPRWPRSWSSSSPQVGARFTHHTLDRADRHDLAVAGQQRQQRHRALVRAPLFPQRDPRGQEVQGEGRRLLLRAAGLPRAGQSARDAGFDRAPAEKLPEYFTIGRRRRPEAARRHPGRGAEVGRLLDLQDRQRARRTTSTRISRTSTCTPTSRA